MKYEEVVTGDLNWLRKEAKMMLPKRISLLKINYKRSVEVIVGFK